MTDAQQLELIRERVKLPYFHTTGEGKDDVCFLLSQLDAANQTIAEYTHYIKDYELMLDQRDCTIRSNVKQIRDLQRQVSDKDRVISNCYCEIRCLRDERNDYKVALEWYADGYPGMDGEAAREALTKHAQRQEDANVPTRETT